MSPQEKRRKANRRREREHVADRAKLIAAGVNRAPHQSTVGALKVFARELDRIPIGGRHGAEHRIAPEDMVE